MKKSESKIDSVGKKTLCRMASSCSFGQGGLTAGAPGVLKGWKHKRQAEGEKPKEDAGAKVGILSVGLTDFLITHLMAF